MRKLISFFALTIILVFSFTNFIGCDATATTTSTSTTVAAFVGYWKSSYGDGFEITNGTPKMFYQYDDASKTVSFAGEIVNSSSLSAETGFATIKITNGGTWKKTVGEFIVIRWKNLAVNVCSQSTAGKLTGGKSTCATQAEAETEFTEDNSYFGYYGEYEKQ